jgi:hypothetical protein
MDMNGATKLVGAADLSSVEKMLDDVYSAKVADVAVAANSTLSGDSLVVRARLKTNVETASAFRAGLFILEDKLTATQSNFGATGSASYNTHNNVLRAQYSTYGKKSYAGESVSPSIKKGEYAEKIFRIKLDSGWIKSNCRYMIVVSHEISGAYYPVYAASASLGSSISFAYSE